MVAVLAGPDNGVRNLNDTDWKILTDRIRDGKCTPFIGPGIYSDLYSIRSTVAEKWAGNEDYPLNDSNDLASVSRFLSVKYDGNPDYAPDEFIKELRNFRTPPFNDPDDPHGILATLPLPIYITTNYDDFMTKALQTKYRTPKVEICRWKADLKEESSYLADGFTPDAANPSVFHLYGHKDNAASLVLTEDDYFQFMINVAMDAKALLIPPLIQKAISNASLLLLGFRLNDWDFRVLFHLLATCVKMNTRATHVFVQVSPYSNDVGEDVIRKIQNYYNKYFEFRRLKIFVEWGTTQDFILKLKKKWEDSGYANGKS
ncbi:MAG: SIR2 family protein [Pyrinomonadaceae bacterium]